MANFHPAPTENLCRYWMRPDAECFIRPDAYRFMAPGSPRWLGKEAVRYFWPEYKTQPEQARHDETEQVRDVENARELAARREDLLRLRRELDAMRSDLKFKRFLRSLKAGFNPNQSRVPRGNPDGGQWTSDGGGGGEGTDPRVLSDATPDRDWMPGAQYAQNRPRGGGGRMGAPTPGQAARLAVAEARARDAIARVREIDPNWRPSPSAYESVEGLIRAHEADAEQAQARFLDLQSHGIGPGPFAEESIPARGPGRDFTVEERREINRIGYETGCHTCGTFNPGTTSGNFVPDHQLPSALNLLSRAQRLYPQCVACSRYQGFGVNRERGRRR